MVKGDPPFTIDQWIFLVSLLHNTAVPGNSSERKIDKWSKVAECDAGNLVKVGEAARQKHRVIWHFPSR